MDRNPAFESNGMHHALGHRSLKSVSSLSNQYVGVVLVINPGAMPFLEPQREESSARPQSDGDTSFHLQG